MAKKFAVIGLGRFGTEVALWLSQHDHPTVAVDKNRELVQEISKSVDNAFCFDSTNESALNDIRVQDMDTVICAIGDHHVQNNILTSALLKQLGVKRIISRASTDLHAKILKIIGVDEIVNPEQEMGKRTAQRIVTPGLTELIPLGQEISMVDMKVPKSFINQKVNELNVRTKFGVNIIGVYRLKKDAVLDNFQDINSKDVRKFNLVNSPDFEFKEEDILVVVGKEKDIKKFTELK